MGAIGGLVGTGDGVILPLVVVVVVDGGGISIDDDKDTGTDEDDITEFVSRLVNSPGTAISGTVEEGSTKSTEVLYDKKYIEKNIYKHCENNKKEYLHSNN